MHGNYPTIMSQTIQQRTQTKKRKPRKQRKVFGGIIETDDITSNPGHNFENWKNPAIKKLKQRETTILATKIEKILSVCNSVNIVLM